VIRRIEELASEFCGRGVSEEKAMRNAAFEMFRGAPTDQLQGWVARLIDLRWPGLLRGDSNDSGRTGGTVHG
jgi:hypothetical protein